MTPYDPPHAVDVHMDQATQFMKAYDKDTCLLGTLYHEEPEWTPHEAVPNYELAAERLGMHLIYVGSEVHTYASNEPFYYVFLSKKDRLTLTEIQRLIPGFEPFHHQDWASMRKAA